MVITTDATFKEEKAKQANQPVYLYQIDDYDGAGTNLYYTSYDTNITYDSQLYTRFPIRHEFIEENTQGQVDTIRLTVSNVSRAIQLYLETYDLRAKKVSIKQVWADQLADTDAYIEYIYYIDNYTADQDNVYFSLTSRFDVMDVSLPSRVFSRNFCSWIFSGTECGYSGSEVSCDKTKTRCKELSNFIAFGGFPSIPTRRAYF